MTIHDIYQRAYVTNDIGRAAAVFREKFDILEFRIIPKFILDASTPSGPTRLELSLAFAWVGETMIELIEPLVDTGRFFAALLPPDGFAAVPHHVSTRLIGTLEDWNRHRDSISRSTPIMLEGAIGAVVRFAFTDERARFGVYLESAWHGLNGEGLPRHVPRQKRPATKLLRLWERNATRPL